MEFVIKGSREFAKYAKNNYDTSKLAGDALSLYYLVRDNKIEDYAQKNIWGLPLLTLKNLTMKYTIEQLNAGNYIFLLNEEQHTRLKRLGVDLCNFWGDKYYSNSHTYGKLEDYLNREILVNFGDIEFETKEIIGYKTPYRMNSIIDKNTLYIKDVAGYCPKGKEGDGSEWYLPKEIVETWEPVYEKVIKFQEIELGKPLRKFTIFKDKIEVITGSRGIEAFNNSHLDHVKACFKTLMELRTFNIDVKAVQIGCVNDGVELRKEDLENIQSIQSKL